MLVTFGVAHLRSELLILEPLSFAKKLATTFEFRASRMFSCLLCLGLRPWAYDAVVLQASYVQTGGSRPAHQQCALPRCMFVLGMMLVSVRLVVIGRS